MQKVTNFFQDLETKKQLKLKEQIWEKKYKPIVESLPLLPTKTKIYNQRVVTVGHKTEIENLEVQKLYRILKNLCPWRKGPFSLFGIEIDSEWQADQKYERIRPFLLEQDISKKIILDIGAGNGYYMFRLVGDGAKQVYGFDPSLLYYAQFLAINHFCREEKISFYPLGWEDFMGYKNLADIILCMGLIYHEENPFLLLRTLHGLLKPKGFLLVESLTIDLKMPYTLFPGKSYANVSGVWHIPSPMALQNFVTKTGFSFVKVISHVPLKSSEQRPTPWAKTKSLQDYLAPDGSLTREGYPPPFRTVVVAKK